MAPAVEVQSLNHWTARETSGLSFSCSLTALGGAVPTLGKATTIPRPALDCGVNVGVDLK